MSVLDGLVLLDDCNGEGNGTDLSSNPHGTFWWDMDLGGGNRAQYWGNRAAAWFNDYYGVFWDDSLSDSNLADGRISVLKGIDFGQPHLEYACMLFLRLQDADQSYANGYVLTYSTDGGGNGLFEFFYMQSSADPSGWASIDSVGATANVGDRISFDVTGSTLTVFLNDTNILDAVDFNLSASGLTGFGGQDTLVGLDDIYMGVPSSGASYTATQGAATAAGLTASPKATYNPTQAAATAAGLTASPKATYNPTQAAATAAGLTASPKATYNPTQAAATAAGLNATVTYGSSNYAATQATATAAGLTASPQVNYSVTQGAATAAGLTASPKVTYSATQATATAAGLTATVTYGSGPVGPDAPVIIGNTRVLGSTRESNVTGQARTTHVSVIVRTTGAIGSVRETGIAGSHSTDVAPVTTRSTDVVGVTRSSDG